jgi:hypothetical protein
MPQRPNLSRRVFITTRIQGKFCLCLEKKAQFRRFLFLVASTKLAGNVVLCFFLISKLCIRFSERNVRRIASLNEPARAAFVRFYFKVLAVFVTQLCPNWLVNILNLFTVQISLILGGNWFRKSEKPSLKIIRPTCANDLANRENFAFRKESSVSSFSFLCGFYEASR